jgi:hypothetical protein
MALRKVDLLVFVPQPRASLPHLRAALSVLGQRAPSMRPDAWGQTIGDPLEVDGLSTPELEKAGIDLDRPIVAFSLDAAQLACLSTKKDVDLRPRLDVWLARRGNRDNSGAGRSAVARSPQGTVVAGYVLKTGRVCVYTGGGEGDAAMKRLGDALAHPQAPGGYSALAAGLHGDAIVYWRDGPVAVAMTASATEVVADGRVARTFLAERGQDDVLACFTSSGIAATHATLSPRYLSDRGSLPRTSIPWLLQVLCPGCSAIQVASFANRLVDELAGTVGVDVVSFRVPRGPRSSATQYQIAQHAYVAATKDPVRATALLDEIAAASKATKSEIPGAGVAAWEAPVGPGTMWFGIKGAVLFSGNDAIALKEALGGATPCPKAVAAASVSLPAAGRDLGRLSILDIGRVPEAAGGLAIALEFGSVLRASGPLTLSADPEGTATRVHLNWSLPPEAPQPGN